MYKIKYLQKALDDLDEIYLYIANENPIAADKMISSILNTIDGLETFPFIGSAVADRVDIKGDYRMIISKPYLVFYRVISAQVIIYRVLHNRRYYSVLLDS